MSDSPVHDLLSALDALDLEAAASLFAADAELLTVYGREGKGSDEVRGLLEELIQELRGAHHEVTVEWHPEPDLWIAELTATYELRDFSRRGPYHRAIVLRGANGAVEQLRMYGAHELPLPDAEGGYREVRGPHGWLPTL